MYFLVFDVQNVSQKIFIVKLIWASINIIAEIVHTIGLDNRETKDEKVQTNSNN